MENIVKQSSTNADSHFKEESVPLILFNNDTQKFEVTEQAKTFLQYVKGPIGVITVAGQYRTGKSYLLNRMLLNRANGFGVGPTINPCTKGLWVWGTPINGFTPEGQPINVLVVDSEGIGGLDEDNNHDMRIFSLALLIASYFLYNSTGSIDENALSNLSLVVNLTKHIQFKTKDGSETDDLQGLLEYLPSFMWVVRDFSLQLVDDNNQEINSRDYLERALQEKGTDSKNEIRQHLKKFFRDRECCTMIRPLTNEDELQNLEHMELDELRAEFVEQVMKLRRKVINQIKPKSINNQVLDGSTWISLVEQYVKAINEGAVPDIQSSWQYICRQKAQQAIDSLKEQFDTDISSSLQFPMNYIDLEQYLVNLKNDILSQLNKQLKGDQEIIDEYKNEMIEYLSQKCKYLIATNIEECKKYASDMLQQLFAEFEQQIKGNMTTIANIEQIDMTLKQLSSIYEQNAFEFQDKLLMLAEAKVIFIGDTLHFFTKHYETELEMQKSIEIQIKDRLEIQLREAKEESRNERNNIEDRLRQTMLEKSELEANFQFTKEQYDVLKLKNEQEELEFKYVIQKLKDDQYEQNEEFRTQKDIFEEKIQELQRSKIQSESEFEKQRALFDQKMEFLEKALQEKTVKERDFMSLLQNKKSEMSGELKSMCIKYENDIKSLTHDIEEFRERNSELEHLLKEKESLLSEKESAWIETESQYKSLIHIAQDQAKQMETALNAIKRQNEQQINNQAKEKDNKVETFQTQMQELEQSLKDTTEQLKQKDHEMKKERAIKDQKVQFLEVQLQECRQQLEDAYRQHDNMVKAMKHENSPDNGKNDSPIKEDQFQGEILRVSQEYEEQIKELYNQNEKYQEKISEVELQLRLQSNDYQRDVSELKSQINETDTIKQGLQEKLRVLESQRAKLLEEAEIKYKNIVSQFEEELELKESQTQQEIKIAQEKSEETLAQLRNFYEIEKEKLESRIAEERDKATRRMHHYQEELEIRTRDDIQDKEEEIECLQNELREAEQRHQQYESQMEHEISLKQQLMETMERQAREAKERIEMMENGRNSAFEKQIENFEQQRQEYNTKIDKLQLENLDKDRQLAQLSHKLERLTDEIERKKHDIEQQKQIFEKEKRIQQEKLELIKRKLSEVQDEAMQYKLESGREQALSKQQIEFQNKKIEELQKQYEDNQKFFEEKIRSYKQEIQNEAQQSIERITNDKELWEHKYEQKRRALKEIETSLNKQNGDLEKKVINLLNQIERQEDEKRQIEENYQGEIQNLQSQIEALDSSAGAAYFYGSAHAEDVMKLKNTLQDLEREHSDLQSTYDRDKALWEGKCQFLESQKETYKRDLMESQKKFEITLEQLQKRGSLDKDKYENNQSALIKVVEGKFKNQIKEMLETHQCLQNESTGKIKRLEGELKFLNEKLQLETRGKMSEQGSLEKKLYDLSESEKRLSQELDEVKNERDRRVQDYQRQLDKEKENYKIKLSEYEQKAKESENRRAALMFEFEKERAKWQLERDNLISQKSETYEQIERLQSRKDQLLRENEKLRNENKGSRKYLFQNSNINSMQSSSSNQSTSATRYMIAKSLSGQGASSNVLNHAITKMKENTKYIGGGDDTKDSKHTTPNSKQNRYGGQ